MKGLTGNIGGGGVERENEKDATKPQGLQTSDAGKQVPGLLLRTSCNETRLSLFCYVRWPDGLAKDPRGVPQSSDPGGLVNSTVNYTEVLSYGRESKKVGFEKKTTSTLSRNKNTAV